jgi:hypothetical protein
MFSDSRRRCHIIRCGSPPTGSPTSLLDARSKGAIEYLWPVPAHRTHGFSPVNRIFLHVPLCNLSVIVCSCTVRRYRFSLLTCSSRQRGFSDVHTVVSRSRPSPGVWHSAPDQVVSFNQQGPTFPDHMFSDTADSVVAAQALGTMAANRRAGAKA